MRQCKKYILTLHFLMTIFSLKVIGQTTMESKFPKNNSCTSKFDSTLNRSYYLVADVMPTYHGGQDSLLKIIGKNLKWPGGDCCYQGTVFITFIIEVDGRVTNKRILKGFQDDGVCKVNTEALKVVDFLTDWTPGQCNGENVPVQFNLPIKFSLK